MKITVFGFPVEIHLSFVLILLLLGSAEQDLGRTALWAVIGAVSILLHELGHAFASRRLGAKPEISLYGMGGATTYVPVRRGHRGDELFVTAAGPAVGITIGLVLIALSGDGVAGSMKDFLLTTGIWVNLGWGLFNLLPVLPLDGGQIAQALLPGDPMQRQRRARMLSILVAALAAGGAIAAGYTFAALFAGYFAFMNLTGLRGQAQGDKELVLVRQLQGIEPYLGSGDYPRVREIAVEVANAATTPQLKALAAQWAAAALIPLGHGQQALTELGALDRASVPVDPTLAALALIAAGHADSGRQRLRAAQAAEESQFDPVVAAYAERFPGHV